jgi:GT2 family glycosyltransferase
MTPKLSVLLCTYNRHELLKLALESIVVETLEKPDQVVVVNGGDEKADKVVQSFMGRHGIDLKLVKTVNKNLAVSRNIGLGYCENDIVAMTDDDAKVFPDWVTQMKRCHAEHPEAGAVGGWVLGTNTDSLVGKVADLITFPGWKEAHYVRSLPGVNISYKKQAIQKIGLQDETLFRGEDVDYNWRILNAGYKIYYDPAIKVYHHHRPTLKGFLNQHYMYGRAYYLVRKKWPAMYSVYPRGIHEFRDVLKLCNFAAALIYQPFLSAMRLPGLMTKITAIPLLFFAGIFWKSGMIRQLLKEKMSRGRVRRNSSL